MTGGGLRRTVVDGGPGRFSICLVLVIAAPLFAQYRAAPLPGAPGRGRALLTGAIRFQNGGPQCAACHSVTGLSFPGGGAMGPDLTKVYSKLGPDGLNSALETLYFPAMTPLFAYRPLTAQERRDLAAFFQSTAGQQAATATPAVGGIAVAGVFVLIGATGLAGRRRLRSVRKALLGRANAQARIHS